MLMGQHNDANHTIILFPAWPVEWDVQFKLRAPLNTTVEATCTNGKVTRLDVTPPGRRKDVVIYGCGGTGS